MGLNTAWKHSKITILGGFEVLQQYGVRHILEKFSTWTKSDHSAAKFGGPFGLDDVLTNVMIYWINGNIISSQRYYKENIPNTELNQLDQFPIGKSQI